jgi:hypothetical protein
VRHGAGGITASHKYGKDGRSILFDGAGTMLSNGGTSKHLPKHLSNCISLTSAFAAEDDGRSVMRVLSLLGVDISSVHISAKKSSFLLYPSFSISPLIKNQTLRRGEVIH